MTISRFYRILLALCGLVGVSIQIHDDGWGMLLYYTVLSNILVFSSLIFFIIYDFKKGDATTNTKLLRYKGGVTMAILITGVIYHILLAPITEPEKFWTLRNFLVHYIVPWGLVLDTLIFDAKKAYRLREPIYWDKVAKLVAADGIGIAQHNVLLWQVDLETNDFVYEDQTTDLSQRLKETFQEWIETLPNQELKQVCDLFFDTILDSGIESLDDIGIKTLPKLGQMLQEFGNLSDQQKKVLQDGFNQLLWIFWKSGNKRSSLPKLELPDFIKKLSELTNND